MYFSLVDKIIASLREFGGGLKDRVRIQPDHYGHPNKAKDVDYYGQLAKDIAAHGSDENYQPELCPDPDFSTALEFAQYLSRESGYTFRKLACSGKYDHFFVEQGLTTGIHTGTFESDWMQRKRLMHALVRRFRSQGHIKWEGHHY